MCKQPRHAELNQPTSLPPSVHLFINPSLPSPPPTHTHIFYVTELQSLCILNTVLIIHLAYDFLMYLLDCINFLEVGILSIFFSHQHTLVLVGIQ